jgi:pimeloyl-ACP methyl ester carboxylesterase
MGVGIVKTSLRLGALISVIVAAALLPAGSPASAAPDPAIDSAPAKITWQPCPAQPTVDCGTVRAPLDYAHPGGASITLGLARHKASDPAHRVGTLFVNPGGPGGSGVEIAEFAELVFSPQLNARFDIVGIDPRGVGASTPVRCAVELNPPGYTLFPRTEQQFAQMVAHNRAVGRSCLKETGPLLGHVDTISTARDIEVVRRALGVSTVNFFGLSYGTQLGANYAQLYPHRVRAMALDAALEHSLSEVGMLADEISTAEDVFDRFAAWCRSTPSCALYGQDVGRVYDDLVAAADRAPIPVPGAIRPVSGEDIRLNTQDKLLFKEPVVFGDGWAALATAIAQARAGNAAAFAFHPVSGPTDVSYAALAIGCMDYPSEIHNFGEMQQRIELGRQLAPHLQGAVQTWTLTRCLGWPVKAANPPHRLDVRGTPPILIINATHDPSTSYKWAHGLAAQIHGSALLTRVGDGHTSYFSSPCAQAAIDRYLIEARTAGPNQVCVG